MITNDGWFDWAERRPGPADKVYSEPCTSELFIPHSAVGWYAGWYSRLFSTARLPNGRYTPYAAASVTGWVELNGHFIQHYPVHKSCWASGSRHPNTKGNAFEHAGGAPGNYMQPFTPEQVNTDIRITLDMQDYHQRKHPGVYNNLWKEPRRPLNAEDLNATLYEHNECTRWGSLPTACPSERLRYAWGRIVTALNEQEEDDNMPDERLDAIYRELGGGGTPVMFQVLDAGAPNGVKSIPLSRLDYLNYKAYGLIVSDANVSKDWQNLIEGASHAQAHGHVITP